MYACACMSVCDSPLFSDYSKWKISHKECAIYHEVGDIKKSEKVFFEKLSFYYIIILYNIIKNCILFNDDKSTENVFAVSRLMVDEFFHMLLQVAIPEPLNQKLSEFQRMIVYRVIRPDKVPRSFSPLPRLGGVLEYIKGAFIHVYTILYWRILVGSIHLSVYWSMIMLLIKCFLYYVRSLQICPYVGWIFSV